MILFDESAISWRKIPFLDLRLSLSNDFVSSRLSFLIIFIEFSEIPVFTKIV